MQFSVKRIKDVQASAQPLKRGELNANTPAGKKRRLFPRTYRFNINNGRGGGGGGGGEGGGVTGRVAQCSYSEAEKHGRIKLSHCTLRKRATYLLIFLCR